ncbi:MAG: hypothetical protein AB7L17_10940 [Ilumatobacteraceae bacterium]
MTRANATTNTDPYLHDLAHLIAANGIEEYETDIARLVVRLRSLGLDSSLVHLLGDHDAPSVARERAFGILVGRLARGPAHRPDLVCSAA